FATRAGWQLLVEKSSQQPEQVTASPLAFIDPMRTIGIRHHPELLPSRYQCVYQSLGSLIVHVVVSGAVHNQKLSLQLRCKGDRRTLLIFVGAILRQTAVP